MSSYSLNQIKTYAHDSIQNIIPLDDESINEMIQYALSSFKTRAAMSNHFLDLLGPSDATFQFVSKLGDMIFGAEKTTNTSSNVEKPNSKKGNVATMSTMSDSLKPKDRQSAETSNKSNIKSKPKAAGIRLVKKQPATSKGRMAGNTSKGATTSDLFNMKPTTVETDRIKKREVKMKLDSIEDLDEVLLQLEISARGDKNDNDIRICNCNATRHKLFEMYPNCLNCGKIICEKEGLQPCSFCGKSLMAEDERREMLEVVTKEKESLERDALARLEQSVNKIAPKPKKKNVIRVTLNTPGQNNFKVHEQLYKQIEEMNKGKQEMQEAKKQQTELVKKNEEELSYYKSRHNKDEELIKAEERLAMLLNFQDNGAERTKIIDHAADFDTPTAETSGSLWASPMERVLQFKRQQKLQKRMHDQELQRSGRGATVINVDIKNGEAVYQNVDTSETIGSVTDNLSDDDEIVALQERVNKEKLNKFHEETQNTYDFTGFEKTFVKPIYRGDAIPNNRVGGEEHSAINNMLASLPILGSVVQPGDAQEQEDRFLTMAGV